MNIQNIKDSAITNEEYLLRQYGNEKLFIVYENVGSQEGKK